MKNEQGGRGGGQKITQFEQTYFLFFILFIYSLFKVGTSKINEIY